MSMSRFVASAILIFTGLLAHSQILDPVDVEHSVERISDTEALLKVTATLEEGWHIYSIQKKEGSFVISTEFNIPESKDYRLVGEVKEPQPKEEYDVNFEEELKFHEHEATFTQKVKILSEKDFVVPAEFVYQVCNEATCLTPQYIDIEFKLKGAPAGKTGSKEAVEEHTSGQTGKKPEADKAQTAQSAEDVAPDVGSEELEIDYSDPDHINGDEADTTTTEVASYDTTEDQKGKTSMLGIFILSFLGGFAALLTPCVFPMIPLTVSFFTKRSKNRAKGIANAMIYGGAIILLYTLLGYAITRAFGADALNTLSTNPYINIFFFVLLVVFAISFFGAFEISLPSSWVNKSDRAADRGGIVGIFFMALTLALVSFSCTGPIIGGLLAEAASGGAQGPLVGMFGFSLALALPFTLFAIFPGWLNSLPKSGGWLNSVKVVLGFIELAFAFKFLSNADLVWQAGLLRREVFIAIWVAILLLLTLYLLGTFKMPHDSPSEKITVPRLLFAVVSLFFVIYLVPGLWGAPLKIFSGFTPPDFYAEAPGGFASSVPAVESAGNVPDGAHPETCPLGLNCFHDYQKGLAYAKKTGKPIMLDFTGWGCANCRKMEANVWSDPRVLDILRDELVIISLYVDDREKLPEDEHFVSDITGKEIKTVGNKWSEFQIKHYQSNSQPQYVMVNHKSLKPLIETTAYDPDVQKYLDWLDRGIKEFKKQR